MCIPSGLFVLFRFKIFSRWLNSNSRVHWMVPQGRVISILGLIRDWIILLERCAGTYTSATTAQAMLKWCQWWLSKSCTATTELSNCSMNRLKSAGPIWARLLFVKRISDSLKSKLDFKNSFSEILITSLPLIVLSILWYVERLLITNIFLYLWRFFKLQSFFL